MAVEAHLAKADRWPIYDLDVDELGPTDPGGSWTALDDRAEW
jgi:hypothetical protein